MRIALINTYPYGGAAIAAMRIGQAMYRRGMAVEMLTMSETQTQETYPFPIEAFANTFFSKKMALAKKAWERATFIPHERHADIRWYFSLANTGFDISQHRIVQEADIIHLHWVNHGFLSLDSLKKLGELGKPIVWTHHDLWPVTGGCHYSGNCDGFQYHCGNCPFLKRRSIRDLSYRVHTGKQKIWHSFHPTLCPTSRWLANQAKASSLNNNAAVYHIPTPIDTKQWQPIDQRTARQQLGIQTNKPLLLFVAMNINDPRKGFQYLVEALEQLPVDLFECLIVGKSNADALRQINQKVIELGFIKDINVLKSAYSAATAFIIPSLEDNLPNVVLESMACGTPVIGFETGGIPEMVIHGESGLIAPQGDSHALSQHIDLLMSHHETSRLMAAASRTRIVEHFSEEVVGQQFLALFELLLLAQ